MVRLILGRMWTIFGYLTLRFLYAVARNWPTNLPSNCWLWAAKQHEKFGGKLVLTPSNFGPWLHCQWETPDGEVWEFNPPSKVAVWQTPCRRRWQGWIKFFKTFPPMLFNGEPVKVRDKNAITEGKE